MVALVIDPSVVGTDAVASVSPHEIPAYEPPAPAVSSHVPDYERVPRAALGAGDPAELKVSGGQTHHPRDDDFLVAAGVKSGSVRYERF